VLQYQSAGRSARPTERRCENNGGQCPAYGVNISIEFLRSSAQRETEEARIVLVALGYGETKIEGDRHLPEEREGQPESKPHARTDCTDFKFAVHGSGVKKGHPAEQITRQREIQFNRAGGHEIAAYWVVIDAGTGADPAVAETPDASDAPQIKLLEKRGITRDIPRICADGQNCAPFQKVLINCVKPVI